MNLKIELSRRRLYSVAENPDMWDVSVFDDNGSTTFTTTSQAQGIEDALKWGGIDGIEIGVKK